jgi:hypothetical protein
MAVVDALATTHALTIDDLAVEFAAILRAIEFNNSIVDAEDVRHLLRFGRDLARLSKEGRQHSALAPRLAGLTDSHN